jgi:hypothetical protein
MRHDDTPDQLDPFPLEEPEAGHALVLGARELARLSERDDSDHRSEAQLDSATSWSGSRAPNLLLKVTFNFLVESYFRFR